MAASPLEAVRRDDDLRLRLMASGTSRTPRFAFLPALRVLLAVSFVAPLIVLSGHESDPTGSKFVRSVSGSLASTLGARLQNSANNSFDFEGLRLDGGRPSALRGTIN